MKRRGVMVMVGVAVIAAVAVAFWPGQKEPEYQGKKLSQWLEIIGAPTGWASAAETDKAEEAIRHIGTNAVPLLLEWTDSDRTMRNSKLLSFVHRLPARVRQARFAESLEERPWRRVEAAQRALAILGPEIYLEPMLNILNDTRALRASRLAVVLALQWLAYPNGSHSALVSAIPLLARCAVESNGAVAVTCISTLGYVAREPEICVPALIRTAQSSDLAVRVEAIHSLGRFGTDAIPGLPVMMKALADTNANVRWAATNAVHDIAPEMLSTNGVAGAHE